MNDTIRNLLDQITVLEEQLLTALREQESKLRYTMHGRRVAFEQSVRDAHAQLKMNVFRWLITVRPQNFLTAPFIYGMIVPLVLADFCVTLYQTICFPIYGIGKVRRRDYIAYDHQHLAYLNWFEKLHCRYCTYANGFLAYALEITARTEQYFCPIKHAHKILHPHARYRRYLAYGDADDYHARLEAFRAELTREAAEQKG